MCSGSSRSRCFYHILFLSLKNCFGDALYLIIKGGKKECDVPEQTINAKSDHVLVLPNRVFPFC